MSVATHPFTLLALRESTGLTRHAITRLVQLGFVTPERLDGAAWRFSFGDAVALRSAQALRRRGVSTRRILAALARLQAIRSDGDPLPGSHIELTGGRISVRTPESAWEVDTGQLLLDFSGDRGTSQSTAPLSLRPVANDPLDIDSRFEAAERLEETDSGKAEAAYLSLLGEHPDHAHAYLNLGFLLCESGRFNDAVALYARAVEHCAEDPLVHYNRGVALAAVQRHTDAVRSYEACVALAPELADAHQNLALLYAELGKEQRAIRHFNDYRRLKASP